MSRCRSISLCVAVASLAALTAPPARADVGVGRVSPNLGRPGQTAVVRLWCGSCPAGLLLPVSLVPARLAPRPHRVKSPRSSKPAIGEHTSLGPLRRPPSVFLGRATVQPERRWPAQAPFRFVIPRVKPGVYAFVIWCDGCVRGPRGSLISGLDSTRSLLVVAGRHERLDQRRRRALRRSARRVVHEFRAYMRRITT